MERLTPLRESASALLLEEPVLADGSAAGTSNSWTGAHNTDWFNGLNWTSGTVPTSGEDVTISGTTDATTPMINGAAYASTLVVGGGTNSSLKRGSLNIKESNAGLTLYGPASKPSLIISGDNSTVTVYNSPTDDETYITGSSVVIGASSAFSSHGNGNLKITGPRSIGKIHELSIDSDVAAPSTFIVDSCILLVYGALNLGGSPTDPKSGSTTSIINVINFNASLYNSAYPIAGDSDYFSCVTSLHNAVITVGGQCDQYFCKAALANSSVLGTHPNSAIHVLECGSLVLWPTFTHGKPTPGGVALGGTIWLNRGNNDAYGAACTASYGNADVTLGSHLYVPCIMTLSNGGTFQGSAGLVVGDAAPGTGTLNFGAAPSIAAAAPGDAGA